MSLPATPASQISLKRQLTLIEVDTVLGTTELLLNNTNWNGVTPAGHPVSGAVYSDLGEWVTELPRIGSTELWEIINPTMDTHPVHLHLIQFQILNRQACDSNAYQRAWAAALAGRMAFLFPKTARRSLTTHPTPTARSAAIRPFHLIFRGR